MERHRWNHWKNEGAPLSNLSKNKQKVLENLKSRDDVVTTNGDKGATVVILDLNGYGAECERQLSNTKHYKELSAAAACCK